MRKAFVIFLMLTLAVVCAAQEKKGDDKTIPDLNGVWMLDKEKSNDEPYFPAKILVEITLMIEQNEPEIKIKRITRSADGKVKVENILYYTDGRRMSLNGKNDEDNYREVEWKGRKLVRKDVFEIKKGKVEFLKKYSRSSKIKFEAKQMWKFSKDENTLTLLEETVKIPNSAPPSTLTLVFRRVK